MVFSSAVFLFAFLPLVLAAYALAPRPARNAVLLAASLLFYAWGECQYVWVLLVSVAGNFAAGLVIERCRSRRAAWWLTAAAVAGNLSLLGVFKYAHFGTRILNRMLEPLGLPPVELPPIHLPLGVSFFTFQAIAYVVDVYRRDVAAERRPVRYGLYATLFPHLVAGPIVRYRDLAGQLGSTGRSRSRLGLARFASGVRRLAAGLGKKVLLANTLAAAADRAFALPPAELGAGAAWLGLLCYSLQIYFDFSGYSDMAIGLGRMFGFEFLENFRHPYTAASVTEFWRRWHISLSNWLRDYVYIPLGGNRAGPRRVFLNQLAVFALCGLWHGAAFQFILWGVWHGLLVASERAGVGRVLTSLPRPLRHAYTLLAVMGGWVLFRAGSSGLALGYLQALLGGGHGLRAGHLLTGDVALALAVAVPACLPLAAWLRARRALTPAVAVAEVAFCGALLALSSVTLAAGSHNPFLYFRF